MWSKSINVEVIVICFLSLIPWPGPSVFKISCSRESSRVVRKIVQSKWIPILEKYQVKLPMECPFHPLRDIFGPQQSAKKQHRTSQWTCGFCGKSFFEEKYLDLHFETRHKTKINMAEDAVCLSDYCDIMRCQVLVAQDSTLSFGDSTIISTDIEIWSESTAYRTALSPSGPRDLAKLPLRGVFSPPYSTASRESQTTPPSESTVADSNIIVGSQPPSDQNTQPNEKSCDKAEQGSGHSPQADITEETVIEKSDESNEGDDETDNNVTTSCEKDLVDSALPPVDRKQQRISELQKLKANCKTEDLDKLKIRCEILVRDCIAGLLMQLSEQDFREMEDELNRAVCWYLTCDRYWEDGPPEPRSFPWGLVFVLVMVLSLGVCFCYYIIWVLFDSSGTDDQSIQSASTEVTAHSSPTHTRQQSNASASSYYHHHLQPQQQQSQHQLQQPHSSSSLTSNNNMQSNLMHQSISPSLSAAAIIQTTSINNQMGNSASAGSGSMLNIGWQQPSGTQQQQLQQSASQPTIPGFPDEYYAAPSDYGDMGQSEHYIYVTYPPELKRRLLESCYNRTTRL